MVAISEQLAASSASIERQLLKSATSVEVCRRFMEIPGVGYLVALSFYCAIENPHRFPSAADIGSYFGLAPRLVQSGNYSTRKGITKHGDKRTRAILVIGATSALREQAKGSYLKDWGLALRHRAGSKKARVALARKLAVVMLRMWKDGSRFDPDFGRTEKLPPSGGAGPDPVELLRPI